MKLDSENQTKLFFLHDVLVFNLIDYINTILTRSHNYNSFLSISSMLVFNNHFVCVIMAQVLSWDLRHIK